MDDLGAGIGFRPELLALLQTAPNAFRCLEIQIEKYVLTDPERVDVLRGLASVVPFVLHGSELSIGTDGPLQDDYVDEIARLAARLEAKWVSDHLCYTRVGSVGVGQLVPLERTTARASAIAAKAQAVQDRVGVPFLLENIAYYFDIRSELSEASFLSLIMDQCDCGILLDVTNLLTNAQNHRFDPLGFLDSIPMDRVIEVHVAGGSWQGGILVDNHSHPVPTEAWDLLEEVLRRCRPRAIILERDADFPSRLEELLDEVRHAQTLLDA